MCSGTACGRCALLIGGRGCGAGWLDMLEALSALMVPQVTPLLLWRTDAERVVPMLPAVPPVMTTSLRARSCASPAVQRRADVRLPLLLLRLNRNAASVSACLRLRLRVPRLFPTGRSLWALPRRRSVGLRQNIAITSQLPW